MRAYVVAYQTEYPEARALADRYDVRLVSVPAAEVLKRGA